MNIVVVREKKMEEKRGEGLAARATIEDLEFEYYVQDWLGANHSILNYNRKTKRDGDEGRPTIKRVLVKVRKMGHDLKEKVVTRAVEVHSF